MSNLKQMGLGVMQYTQDYDEKYPYGAYGTSEVPPTGANTNGYWQSGVWFWQQIIYPYTKSEQIYRCPSSNYGGKLLNQGNYGANWLVTYPPVSIATVASTASTYFAMDSGSYIILPQYIYAPAAANWYLPGTGPLTTPASAPWPEFAGDFNTGRHFDGVTMCFADGHVKWLRSSEVLQQARNYQAGTKNAWDPANPN